METHEYVSLDELATRLRLPRSYLREHPKRGAIPHLRIGGRLRFEETAVRGALRQQAARPPSGAEVGAP
jgi:excisionase family DNA binding protein